MSPQLPTMDTHSLYDFMEALYFKSSFMAADWRESIDKPSVTKLDPETCRRYARKWEEMALVFRDARDRIKEIAPEDFKRESCGA